jgi:hypothetical protein
MIDSLADVRPGDIIFGPIRGAVGGGIGAAQLLLAAAEPGLIWRQGWREWWKIRHVLVITEAGGAMPGELAPRAVQAMPRGAEEIALQHDRFWTSEYVFVRPAYDPGKPFELGYQHRSQGFKVAQAAKGYIGTPYNFATYAAIPAHRAHIPVPHLDRFIASRKDMMCSQLADQCLADGGWHVFDDGRLPQDVTPSELYRAMLLQPTLCVRRGGV